MYRLTVCLLLVGCSATAFQPADPAAPGPIPIVSDGTTTGGTTDTTTTGTLPEEEPVVIVLPSDYEWTGGYDYGDPVVSDVLAAAFDDAVDDALSYAPPPIFAAYTLAMQAARSDCPNTRDSTDGEFWTGGCTTSDGSVFDGYASVSVYADGNFDGIILSAEATIVTATGHTFVSAGHASDLVQTGLSDDRRTFEMFIGGVAGTNSWDGPGVTGTWMEAGLQPAISFNFTEYEDGAREGLVAGVVAVDSEPFGAVAYDVEAYSADSGAACWAEPAGSVSLRDSEGNWYEARFDGGMEVEDLSACDGCGTVYWRGQGVAEVCPDFSGWLSWRSAPW